MRPDAPFLASSSARPWPAALRDLILERRDLTLELRGLACEALNVAFEALDHRGRGRDRGLSQTLSTCLSLGCERNSNDGIQKTEFVEL